MRVLLASSHGADRTFGGAERYVEELASELDGVGHETLLLSAFPVRDASAQRTVSLHRTDWRENRTRRYRNHLEDWIAAPHASISPILKELAPDLIHTNNLPGITTGIWEQARRLGIPVVHTLHDYSLLCPRTSLTRADMRPCQPHPLLCGLRSRRLARWTPGVSAVIGVSEFVLRRHDDFFPASTPRVVIRGPVVPLLPSGTPPAHEPPRTIGYLGALTAAKGVPTLLAAAPRLAELGVTLRIAGDGPLREEVAASPHLRYEGRLEGNVEIGHFIDSCDLGVVTSVWDEPGPYVLYEWIACRRPLVTTGRGGMSEARKLGGVMTFGVTAADLVDAVVGLQDRARWTELVDSLPVVDERRDVERWVEAHRDAYRRARPTGDW